VAAPLRAGGAGAGGPAAEGVALARLVVLFSTWRSNLRRYADVVACLAADGHEVVIASPAQKQRDLPPELQGRSGVRTVSYDEVADPEFGRAIGLLRNARDYLWYLSPAQRLAVFNRRQALDRLVRGASAGTCRADPAWPDPVLDLNEERRASLEASLGELDEAIPPDPGVLELIRTTAPDVVLVSPLLKQLLHQTEIVKAAQALGIPVGFLVYSWDNLSNKGRVHVPPDRTFVWNERQRQEAIELHGLDPGSISTVGAPHWDAFFSMQPSRDRREFCEQHGFDPATPIVLYLGSTTRICPDEPRVVELWLDALRSSSGDLRDANVLVRPHPDETARWREWTPPHARVAVSRRPHQQDQSLYDELHHAVVAVGLNTSAQIEASILGTPVYTFAAGELAPGQAGTLHFRYLLRDEGGVVTLANSLAEHVAQLERGIAGDYDREAIRRFCESFVRPHGLGRPVAPLLAREVAALATQREPARDSRRARV
jgi:hypothetical protein